MTPLLPLPRGHLSWSGLSLWETSPTAWREKYLLNQDQHTNSGMVFGKYIAEKLEEVVSSDPVIEKLRADLPRYDVPELEIDPMWKGIQLLGRIDSYRSTDHAFREYKTGRRDKAGKAPWNSLKARLHGQLAFYAFMIWLRTKKIPPQVHLDWIETEEIGGKVRLTGHIESFEVPMNLMTVLNMGVRIERAANDISKEYLKYLTVCQQSQKPVSRSRRSN
jgi:hypothetical protein